MYPLFLILFGIFADLLFKYNNLFRILARRKTNFRFASKLSNFIKSVTVSHDTRQNGSWFIKKRLTMTSNKPKIFKSESGPADFQAAIAATGFGKFNVILLLICIPGAWTVQFESSLVSFIVPVAACDLNLTLSQKGLLNSMAFIGMVSSGLIWGFLLDTLGRKKILFLGFMIESFITLGQSLSQEFYFLSIFKFFGGTISGGIYVALSTYLLEFHSTEHRGKVQMIYGMMYCGANIAIPLLSFAILPLKLHLQLFFIDLYSWNLLIFVSTTTSVISAICFYFLPETPKFLMSIGNNEEALRILNNVYNMNNGKSADNYPIHRLIEEIGDKNESAAYKNTWKDYFKSGWQQISPLFGKEHGPKLFLVCVVQGTILMGINAIRLYSPQIFQGIHEYEVANNGTSPKVCDTLDILRSPKPDEEYVCSVNLENNFNVYLNSAITAIVALVGYGITGTLINLFGKKRLLDILGIIASVSISLMYFSKSTNVTISLCSIYLATSGICFDLFVTVIVVLFPTTLRAMAFSLCILIGRSMTVLGNMVFPILVETGCAPPFFTLGGLVLIVVLLACLVPNTDKVDMK